MSRLILWCCIIALNAGERNGRAFDREVAPILKRRCLPCHNDTLNNGRLSLQDRESLLKGGSRGPAIVPGEPDRSLLMQTLSHRGDLQMPPGPRLPAKEIAILKDWIRRGAIWSGRLE